MRGEQVFTCRQHHPHDKPGGAGKERQGGGGGGGEEGGGRREIGGRGEGERRRGRDSRTKGLVCCPAFLPVFFILSAMLGPLPFQLGLAFRWCRRLSVARCVVSSLVLSSPCCVVPVFLWLFLGLFLCVVLSCCVCFNGALVLGVSKFVSCTCMPLLQLCFLVFFGCGGFSVVGMSPLQEDSSSIEEDVTSLGVHSVVTTLAKEVTILSEFMSSVPQQMQTLMRGVEAVRTEQECEAM